MQNIKVTVLCLCMAMVAIGFIFKLFPKTLLKNNIKNLFSVIILLIIISPLSGSYDVKLPDTDLFSEEYSLEQYEEEHREFIARNTVKVYKASVIEYLNKKGIEVYGVEIQYEINGNSADITGMTVYIKSGYSFSEVKNSVEKEFKIPVTVEAGG